MKKLEFLLTFIFLISGAVVSFLGERPLKVLDIKEIKPEVPALKWVQVSPEISLDENSVSVPVGSNPKLTITETEPLTAGKSVVQTGESVDFRVKLKNEGNVKKLLTEICFNDSLEGNFGCIRNKNLEPGETFGLNAYMMYKTPGYHRVSLFWSQDHKNYYPPRNSAIASVTVY